MATYVAICIGHGRGSQWGNEDQSGYLLRDEGDGWSCEGSHLSSSVGYAKGDVQHLFDTRREPDPSDTYRWVGQLTVRDVESRFPPQKSVDSQGSQPEESS